MAPKSFIASVKIQQPSLCSKQLDRKESDADRKLSSKRFSLDLVSTEVGRASVNVVVR